jgi:hypothetical protein
MRPRRQDRFLLCLVPGNTIVQQIEDSLLGQSKRLPAITGDPEVMAAPPQKLFQELGIELIVLGH